MKNTNILKVISFVLLLGLLTGNSFANIQLQKVQMNREANFNKNVESSEDKFSFKVEGILNKEEIERLILQYEDEYAAIGIYNYFYELYGLQVFKNIADSEQKHLNAITELMNAYDLKVPTSLSPEFLEEVEHLIAMGEGSLKEALEAGVLFEIRDIEDIAKTISLTQNDDIIKVMLNIGGGSFNHLRGFLTNLEKQGFTTNIDYSDFLTTNDLSKKGLKDKFIPYLNNMGINIDETLLNIKDNNDKKSQQKGKGNGQGKSGEMKGTGKDEAFKNTQKQRKEIFKNRINNEMGVVLRSTNTKKLQNVLTRLEVIIENTKMDENISQDQKQKIMPIYNAFKEVILDIID